LNQVKDVFNDLLQSDSLKASFSVVFVFGYLNFHLRSFFISLVGVTLIVLSFPITVLITDFVLQVKYFGSL